MSFAIAAAAATPEFKDLSKIWKEALVLGLISIVGSALGALYLVWLSDNTFKSMVPWLLLACRCDS